MFDPKTLEQDRELKGIWTEQFNNVKEKFIRKGEYEATSHSGIPLKPLYTPEDI